ncbi:MAG: extracellular solute-binding protein [Candidatus Dormibacteraeota bacterium]|nr:extracellular solute-binding protein [Candidatus Dormibacteraeota bacterium]MBV9525183.1 extracellular solute-binding protein [Candidatus Dormibacteraeota bacterium]
MNPRAAVAALAVAIVVPVAGCDGQSTTGQPAAALTPYLRQLVAQAQKEGELDLIYASGDTTDEINAWRDGFNRYYGLSLNIVPDASPLMPANATRVLQEYQAHRPASTDVYFGVSVFVLELEQAGAALTGSLHDLPNVSGLTEDGDTTVRLAALPSGIMYNSDRVKGANVPHSLDDVLSEPSGIRIASSPYAGTLAALPEFRGVDQAITYAVHLSKKLKGLFGCGEESRLVTGEFDMFVTDCGDSAGRRLAAQGAPIAESFPTDGSVLNSWYLVIPRNAAHPAAARLWINYLLSREAQDVLFKYDLVDNPSVSGSQLAALISADQAKGVMFRPSDMNAARADAPFAQAGTCVQAIINNQVSDPSCAPYRSVIAEA